MGLRLFMSFCVCSIYSLSLKSFVQKKKRKKKRGSSVFALVVLCFCAFFVPVWALVVTFEQAFGLRLCAFLESGHLLQDVLPSGATLWAIWMGFLHVVLPPGTSFLGRRCHPQGPIRQQRALCWPRDHHADRRHQCRDVQLLERARLQQRGNHLMQRWVLPSCGQHVSRDCTTRHVQLHHTDLL